MDHFANSVGQEVSGLATLELNKRISAFKEDTIQGLQKAKQAENFTNAIRDLAVDELARQNPGMTETELKQLKQDMANGTVPTPAIKFMQDQKDADGNKVLGAFDAENNEILLDKDLYDQAAAGDMDATAKLLGVYLEEQGHAVASVMEQRMGVQDFRFDEGGMVARELLKDFSASGGNFGFSLNIAGNTTDFVTSAEAINNAIDTQFTSARLLSDRRMGVMEFSSSNNSNMYKVQSGDTFWDLAKADLGGVASEAEIQARTQQYLAANEGVDPLGLQVGQEVVIPGMEEGLEIPESLKGAGLSAQVNTPSFISVDGKLRVDFYNASNELIPEKYRLGPEASELALEQNARGAHAERNMNLDETRRQLSKPGLAFSKFLKEDGIPFDELVAKKLEKPEVNSKSDAYRAVIESSGTSRKSVTDVAEFSKSVGEGKNAGAKITAKVAGPLAVVGAFSDGYAIGEGINQSIETGEIKHTTREVSRVAGGWGGAYAGGVLGAEAGAWIGAGIGSFFFGAGAAPGAAIGSVIGGVGGSIAGYFYGSEAALGAHEAVTE